MVNINEEIVYDKQSDFIKYLLAIDNYEDKYEDTDFNPIVCYRGECFYMSEGDGVTNTNDTICKAIELKLNSETLLIQLAKIDYDYGVFEIEDDIEKEAMDIIVAFRDYCRITGGYGFIIQHFGENDIVDSKMIELAKHSHIVYVTEPGNKSFSDYLLEILY